MNLSTTFSGRCHRVIMMTKDGKLVGWGNNENQTLAVPGSEALYKPTEITLLPFPHQEVIQVSFGSQHTMMLTRDRCVMSKSVRDG
jgi:alpha-tubulin suppressor-like RCC1 family protein